MYHEDQTWDNLMMIHLTTKIAPYNLNPQNTLTAPHYKLLLIFQTPF